MSSLSRLCCCNAYVYPKEITQNRQFDNLRKIVGIATDSCSLLSYTRHKYFRRIVCNMFDNWVENGEGSYDEKLLGKIMQDICYYNTVRYFSKNKQ